jgi:hypothetical protein
MSPFVRNYLEPAVQDALMHYTCVVYLDLCPGCIDAHFFHFDFQLAVVLEKSMSMSYWESNTCLCCV